MTTSLICLLMKNVRFVNKPVFYFYFNVGTGLLHILGIDKFKELLGMTYKKPCYNCLAQGLSVILVIDGTGSVSGEIRAATRNSIDVNQLESNGSSQYFLSLTNIKVVNHFMKLQLMELNILIIIFFCLLIVKDRKVLESLSDTSVMKLSRDMSLKSGPVPSKLTSNYLING